MPATNTLIQALIEFTTFVTPFYVTGLLLDSSLQGGCGGETESLSRCFRNVNLQSYDVIITTHIAIIILFVHFII